MSSLRRLTLLALFFPMIFAANCRERRNVEVVDGGDVDPTPPQVTLQVTSVDPNRPAPNEAFQAIVLGSGFEEGATVRIGDIEPTTTNVVGDGRIAIRVPALDLGGYDVQVRNPDGTVATLRAGIVVRASEATTAAICRSMRIGFDLDQSSINGAAQRQLGEYSSCFQVSNASFRIEGHCDERGTTDYNMALGQRRAEAVKRYLVAQGVPPSRITTVSFGEEKPLASGSSENAWSQNRRAEIILSQ